MTGDHRDDEPGLWLSCLSSLGAFVVAMGLLAFLTWLASIVVNKLL